MPEAAALGSKDAVLTAMRELLERDFGVPEEHVKPQAHLFDDLGLDSVDAVSLLSMLEDAAGVILADDDVRSLRTVNSVLEIVSRYVAEKSGEPS